MADESLALYSAHIEASLGPFECRLAHHWPNGGGAAVWKITAGNAEFALKVYTSRQTYERERWAYDTWLSKLDAGDCAVPRLIAAFDEGPGALLLPWIDGEIAERHCRGQGLEVYESAGRCLAQLHRVVLADVDPAQIRTTTREKALRRAAQCASIAGERIARWAKATIESDGWDELETGVCHRDYSPRNWMMSNQEPPHRVTVIDFEHAAFDYRACDVMKLWDGPFRGHGARKQAFYEGYGRSAEEHLTAIRLLAPLHGLAIVAWSQNAGNAVYLQHGLTFLQRCAEGDEWLA